MGVFNHEWWEAETFAALVTILGKEVAEISDGALEEGVDVRINRLVVEHDVVVVCGPFSRTRWAASPAATSASFLGWAAPRS